MRLRLVLRLILAGLLGSLYAPCDLHAQSVEPQEPHVVQVGCTHADVERIWSERREALKQARPRDADASLDALLLCKQRAGWPDFFAQGEALAYESRKAAKAGKLSDARKLSEAALQMAPHRLSPHIAQMTAAWRQGQYKQMATGLRGALGLVLAEAPYRLARLSAYGLWLLYALCLSLVGLAVATLYRYAVPLWHDIWHKLPRRLHPTAQGLLMCVLVLAPAFLCLGPVSWALVWLGVLAPYMRRSERMVAIAALVTLALFLCGLPWLGRAMTYAGSGAEAAYLAARDIGADVQAQRLSASSRPAALDCLGLGLRARWQGNIIESRRWLERALRTEQPDTKTQAATYLGLGNARWLQQAPNEAIAAYQKAIALDPSNVYALFNLSQVRLTLVEPQDDTRQQASRINHDLVVQLKNQAKQTGIAVAEAPVPNALLHRNLHQGAEYAQALRQLYRPLGGPVPRQAHAGLAVMLGLYMLWLGQPMALRRRTTDCRRCGDAICFRCQKGPAGRTHCSVCAKIGSPAADADRQARIKKEIASHRFFARRLAAQRRLAWLVPGAGQFIKGEAALGFIIVLAFSINALALLSSAGFVSELLPYYAGLNGLLNVAHGLCLATVYVAALVFGLREES